MLRLDRRASPKLRPTRREVPFHSSIVSRTRWVMTAGSSSKANNTDRSKPCGPVMTTRTPPRNGSAAIHPSYCSLPMLLVRTEMLPTGRDQVYELKFDGFRAQAIKSAGTANLRSRNNKDFNARYPVIAKALSGMPDDTVIDREVVALD